MRSVVRVTVIASVLLSGAWAWGQEKGAPETATELNAAPPEHDPLNRETPRGTLRGFLEAAEGGDYERASSYLDLRFIRFTQYSSDETTPELLAERRIATKSIQQGLRTTRVLELRHLCEGSLGASVRSE